MVAYKMVAPMVLAAANALSAPSALITVDKVVISRGKNAHNKIALSVPSVATTVLHADQSKSVARDQSARSVLISGKIKRPKTATTL
jgi:hypothetical protein